MLDSVTNQEVGQSEMGAIHGGRIPPFEFSHGRESPLF